ncbi:hypothetical protein Tco_1269623 [Tanacetum coccineum]
MDDLFRIRGENLRSMEQIKVLNRCDEEIVGKTDQEDGELLDFDTISVTNVLSIVYEHVDVNVNISIAKEKEEVTIEDAERLRQILTPVDDTYDVPATDLIFDELVKEFRDDILNINIDDEEADCNPTRDIVELERLLAKDTQSHITEKKVHSVMVKTNEEFEPFIHTQQLNPLYGVIKSFKSSTKPYKVKNS